MKTNNIFNHDYKEKTSLPSPKENINFNFRKYKKNQGSMLELAKQKQAKEKRKLSEAAREKEERLPSAHENGHKIRSLMLENRQRQLQNLKNS